MLFHIVLCNRTRLQSFQQTQRFLNRRLIGIRFLRDIVGERIKDHLIGQTKEDIGQFLDNIQRAVFFPAGEVQQLILPGEQNAGTLLQQPGFSHAALSI